MVDWTQIAVTAITTLGGVLSVFFAQRAKAHASDAAVSADRAIEASLRPPPEVLKP
jgi:hypothetical protein